jgi:hypothetical protein
MKKFLVLIGVLVALVAVILVGLKYYTKSFSPQDKTVYSNQNIELSVDYSRPYKKGRVIFGGLVPYDKVWRTGANEPTVFISNVNLKIGEKILPKGTYSLFTIPGKEKWEVIFNKDIPEWGIEFSSSEATRDSSSDELIIEVSAISTKNVFEQFTIDFEEMHEEIDLVMMWDQTLIVVPMITAN